MVSFPVFQTLTIENYGLFPSSYTRPFNVTFNPGQTVIVGVNGSGKSTMVTLLLRMLTGPFDLPAARSDEELGQIRPEAARFDKHERSYFGSRVADGAKSATARLVVKFGAKTLVVQRRLSDLSLASATVSREATAVDGEEKGYQIALAMFAFPVFRLAMTGGAVAGLMVREGPDSVSQSQAEFVDLAFRMALMTIAAPRAAASLVVDAPEASLDFLFATRAGYQLSEFASSNKQNRVIVTSYLPSQHFVSAFIDGITGQKKRRERIVNLISGAAANAAMRSDRAKYTEFLDNIIKGRRP